MSAQTHSYCDALTNGMVMRTSLLLGLSRVEDTVPGTLAFMEMEKYQEMPSALKLPLVLLLSG